MVRKAALAALVLVSLAACSRIPEPSQLSDLTIVGPAVLRAAPESGSVPSSQWPASLVRLKPERVYSTPEGLYVVTSSSFVEEQGLFVPRSASFTAQPGSDPEYTPIGQGLFSYRIRG